MKNKFISYLFLFLSSQILFSQVGINTTTPKTELDVNGAVTIRDTPTFMDGEFRILGVNEDGLVMTKNDGISSYNVYLGFSPEASTHQATIPIQLKDNYISSIKGTCIGACYGVLVNFEINFLGKRYLGASLQALSASTRDTMQYSPVFLNANQSVFDKPLEVLAGPTLCSSLSGHTLSFNSTTGEITVTFLDTPTYYPDAGTFVIYSFDSFLQHK